VEQSESGLQHKALPDLQVLGSSAWMVIQIQLMEKNSITQYFQSDPSRRADYVQLLIRTLGQAYELPSPFPSAVTYDDVARCRRPNPRIISWI
jgi:hypothetical protein